MKKEIFVNLYNRHSELFIILGSDKNNIEAKKEFDIVKSQLRKADWKMGFEYGNYVPVPIQKEPKFHTAHFPKGTVVEWSAYRETKKLVVDHVICNGPNSFCIVSKEIDPKLGISEACNIHHVKRIITRGTGDIYGNSRSNTVPNKTIWAEYKEDVHYAVCGKSQELCQSLTGESYPAVKKPKNKYLTMNARYFIMELIDRYVSFSMLVDYDLFVDTILRSSDVGVKFIPVSSFQNCCLIDKKKIHRFIRRNINRFLQNRVKAEDEHENMLFRDSLLEDNYVETHPVTNEGSCYDDNDLYRDEWPSDSKLI